MSELSVGFAIVLFIVLVEYTSLLSSVDTISHKGPLLQQLRGL